MSGTTRRAKDPELPLLPPLSQPPDAAATRAPDVEIHAGAAGRAADDARALSLRQPVLLNNKFQRGRQLASREEELLYEGLHTGTGRNVQIHMLPPEAPADSAVAHNMLRAARAAGRVPHLNVLSVVDSGTDDQGRPFFVYEHFAGAAADELVAKHGPLSARVAAEVMSQVLEGLHALHTRGVVHRNIKPENVLVDGLEGQLRVKLTGFRYAFISGKTAAPAELPRSYSRYLAPEARRNIGTTEPAIDVYAAGVLMRFLLSGETDPQVALDPKAARAIARATAEDADERCSAENFLSAVGMLMPDEGQPMSAPPADALAADLRYMQQRRERESGVGVLPTGSGRMELFPVLMMIEAVYAQIGAEGWQRLLTEVPEAESLLPAAGRGDHHREHGVPVKVVARLLGAADEIAGRGDLSWLPQVGAAMVKRGLAKFCTTLPKVLTPDVLVACVPSIWSCMSRHGEVVVFESLPGSARIGIRAQVEPCLEVCAVMAGLLRAQLRALTRNADVSTIASQALGDAADLFVLTWA